MSDGLTIRSAESDDIPALFRLYAQLHPNDTLLTLAEAERIFERFCLYPGSSLFLGFLGDVPVTTCTLVVIPNLSRNGAPYALIENVVTDGQFRNRGWGKTILNEAISVAWRWNCYKVMLLTGAKDAATLNFYRSAGFENSKTGFQIRRHSP
ncbi:MAG: GNAT family N-acetyltransferase [Stappiaceae bacterium]